VFKPLFQMPTISQRLNQFFLPYPNRPIIIAYSGGVDSQVLLHTLSALQQAGQLDNPISVLHVNHGLSRYAQAWQDFAELECQRLGLPLTVSKVEVKPQPQQSLEALAREARYQAILAEAPDNALIVTGHHRDDQVETFLLALKRGAGIKGLSAMSSEVKLGEHLLVRPLLEVSRQDILACAEQRQLSWVEDESNQDSAFDRNFLRNEILPLLNQRWPGFTDTVKRSAEHCQEGQGLLDDLAELDLRACAHSADALALDELSKLSRARFNNALRYFLQQLGSLMPSTEQLNQVYQQMSAAQDKTPAVKVGNNWLRRYQNRLYFTPDYQELADWQTEFVFHSSLIEHKVNLPDSLGSLVFNHQQQEQQISFDPGSKNIFIRPPEKGQGIEIRFGHANPKCLPHFRQQRRPLKKVLQEMGIPSWQRKRIPFIYYGDTLVAAMGYFVCKEYLPQPGQPQLNVLWLD